MKELALKFLDALDALGLPKFPSYGAPGPQRDRLLVHKQKGV